ncbi:hypothetical protein STVA_14240 [Allostella vacuolata]|nr:hypothetical protein STVA_14240 [Stella vacuolata]
MDEESIRQQLRYRSLEAFRIVYETGSVTRAAERLDLSQPAVSQLIARIERSFGFSLFDRGLGRRLEPTAAARALHADVCRTLEAMARMEATVMTLAAPRSVPDIGGTYRGDRVLMSER